MTAVTKTILILAVGGILAKLLLGGKVDKNADIPALIANGSLLVDVRTPDEYVGGHIKNSINIPVSSIATGLQKEATDKSQTIIIYCRSGARSGVAKKILLQAGYTHVINAGSLRRMRKLLGE